MTISWSYRPGPWFAVFGDAATVLLPESEKARVGDLWARIDGGAGFDEVLDALLQTGLGTLPGFVLVSTVEGPTKILLRGSSVVASVVTAAETVELTGAGALTWVERTLDGVESISFVVAAEEEGDEGGTDVTDLPIAGGLVRVSRVDQPAILLASTAPMDLPEPEPEPESESETAVEEPVLAAEPVAVPAEPEPTPEPDPEPAVQPEPEPEADAMTEQLDLESSPLDDDHDTVGVTPPSPPPSPFGGDTGLPPFPPAPVPAPPAPPAWPGDAAADPFANEGSTPPPPPPPPYGAPVPDGPPIEPEVDHDGLTQVGADPQEFARQLPGIAGQPMAPNVVAPVARLIVSNGEVVEVDRVVLIGRAPEARRFTSTEQPRLVKVPSPLHEISSTHVEVRPGSGADHGSAVVTDMGSTNGTVLELPGLGAEELKPGIAVQLVPGAVINLGDGVTIQVTHP